MTGEKRSRGAWIVAAGAPEAEPATAEGVVVTADRDTTVELLLHRRVK